MIVLLMIASSMSDELGRNLGVALIVSLCPVVLDGDGTTLNPAECAQSAATHWLTAEGVLGPRKPMVRQPPRLFAPRTATPPPRPAAACATSSFDHLVGAAEQRDRES